MERRPFSVNPGFMNLTRIVEGRVTLQLESHTSANRLDTTHYLPASRRSCVPANWHVISNLGDPIRREESCNEDIRIRPIKLFESDSIGLGRNFEISAFLVIEDGGEDARRVKSRITEPLNRPIHSYQSHCLGIADDSVVFYWLIGHIITHRIVQQLGRLTPCTQMCRYMAAHKASN